MQKAARVLAVLEVEDDGEEEVVRVDAEAVAAAKKVKGN